MASMFRETLDFFGELGIYDVVLPFLLIFTVMFAFLEKTKILGEIKIGDDMYTRKNLNSMIAFSIAFLAIASTKVVSIINEGVANITIIMMTLFCFLLLASMLFGESAENSLFNKDSFFAKNVRIPLLIATLIVVLLIFLHSVKTADGTPWLIAGYNFLASHWDSTFVASVMMLLFLGGFVLLMVRTPKNE